jgi:hypothetical protein
MKKLAIVFTMVICVLFTRVIMAQEQKELPESDDGVITGSVCETYPDNLVTNCGFEIAPAFSGWTRSGDQSFTNLASECRHSGVVGVCTGPIFNLGFISQFIGTEPGASYDLSFWLARQGRGGIGRFQVSWDGEIIYDRYEENFPYQLWEFPGLIASGELTELKFGFHSVIGYFWLDDVVVVPSP